MLAGSKTRSTLGLQRSSPKPPQTKSSSAKQQPQPTPSNSAATHTRSFGAYFPRASAQVQPRTPGVSELLSQIEELRERESRLKTELLELKLVRESAAVVPVLESEIADKNSQATSLSVKIECLEAENERLRMENEFLNVELCKQNHKYQDMIKNMQSELSDIKKAFEEKEKKTDCDNSSTSSSSSSDKSLRRCILSSGISGYSNNDSPVGMRMANADENEGELTARALHVPKPPPPRPSSSSSLCSSTSSPSYGSLSDSADRALAEISNFTPHPPPSPPPLPPPPTQPQYKIPSAPPPPRPKSCAANAPPPPPPPPPKGLKMCPAKVRRIPEVVELYHSLMRRDSGCRREPGGGGGGTVVVAKDMIGEIENRSAHLLAIKTDVETQGDFIRSLIKEVEGSAFTDIEDVITFVKWLDDELSFLVDERAVLKHFDWPEHKADALREAAFGFCDLKKLESEVSSFRDDPRQPCALALKKMQSLFEKLEHRVYNLSRMRESAAQRYKAFHIPMDWMSDTGYVSQIKLASVKLAMKYLKRVSAELGTLGVNGPEDEELIVQGVKFAFRVHQFAGGFNVDTMRAFKELRDKAQTCQNQHQQRLICRSSSSSSSAAL